MNRRLILQIFVSAVGLLGLRRGSARGRPAATTGPVPAGASRLPWPRPRHSAALIGRAYLRQRPHEADTELLLRALALPGDATRQPIDGPTLQRRIRDDFSRGRVVAVERWVLSVTEARLCALRCLSR